MLFNVPDEIKLATGASATIKLKGLATAGYVWNYTTDADENAITVSKDFVESNDHIFLQPPASSLAVHKSLTPTITH